MQFNDSSETFKNHVKNALLNMLTNWKFMHKEQLKVLNYYLSNETEIDRIKNKVGQIFGDSFLVCPTYFMAKDIMLWSGDNKVYFYKLTHRTNGSLSSIFRNQKWTGICHGEDIPFVFGDPFINPNVYSKQDFQFSFLIMNLWTNFAKTG